MRRFTLHRARGAAGYALVVQSDHLDALRARAVLPLLPIGNAPPPLPGLNPEFVLEGERLVMATHLLSAVDRTVLGPAVGDLAAERDRITAALDLLLTGF
ncbi:MAG: CcdB family protein [Pseudomonadota bacterium]